VVVATGFYRVAADVPLHDLLYRSIVCRSGSGDRLGSAVLKDLVLLPLVTATIAWATATATARLRPSLAASLASVPVTATGPAGEPSSNPVTTPHEARPVVRIRSWHGAAWLLLLWAGVAAAVFLAVVSGLRG